METLPLMQYLMTGALGLGLAACSGFRVFVPAASGQRGLPLGLPGVYSEPSAALARPAATGWTASRLKKRVFGLWLAIRVIKAQ